MAKVIAVDNYARESVSDRLVEEGLTMGLAKHRANQLNADTGPNSDRFYKAVEDDHELYRFEP